MIPYLCSCPNPLIQPCGLPWRCSARKMRVPVISSVRLLAALALLILVGGVSLAAEPNEVMTLWPGTPPGPSREVGEEADITKPTDRLIAGRKIIKLANVATPEAHVYLPEQEKRSGSTVIVCPGGGYSILAWDLEGTEVAEWLNSIGVTAVVLKYRVPTRNVDPMWLQPVQDAQRTISLVRSRADEWGLNSSQIGVLGFSAGGDTAARTALATMRHYEPIDDADKQSYSPNAGILVYPAYLTNEQKTGLSEELAVGKNSPSIFLVHAFDDPVTVESSLYLSLALTKADVPNELHVYDTGGHGYGLRHVDSLPVTNWPQRCAAWLQRNNWAR